MKKLSRLHWLISLIVFVLSISACHVEDDKNDVIVTIPPEYAVDIYEYRAATDGTPTFGLWIESMDKYRCPGYLVDALTEIQNGRIGVTILGVTEPTPCVGDSAPVKQFLPIGNLADGIYEFVISLRDVIVNKGTLDVTNGHYALSLPDAQGIIFDNFIVETLPEGIIWGYASTPDEPSQPIADDFLADLKTVTAEDNLDPGFYSYFTVSGTGNVSLHKSIAPDGISKPFVRRLTGSTDALKGILQSYRDATPKPLVIKCWTTEGEL